jgi:hypothetical protein
MKNQEEKKNKSTKAILMSSTPDLPNLEGISRLKLMPITNDQHDEQTHALLAEMAEGREPYILVPVDEDVLTKTVAILRTGNYPYAVANIDENITTPIWLDLMKQSQVVDLAAIVRESAEEAKDARRVEQAGSETAAEIKKAEQDEDFDFLGE